METYQFRKDLVAPVQLKDAISYAIIIQRMWEQLKPERSALVARYEFNNLANNLTQLRAFLGMVQYYSKFLPDLATQLAPLHRLLQKEVKWSWGAEEETSFRLVKGMLLQDKVLIHYDPDLPLVLATDSSLYGLGAVLSHCTVEGVEWPIAYPSLSLSEPEKKYSQIEKEALSLVWGVKNFQTYLEGYHFTLVTDHQPLKYIMDPGKAVPVTSAARIQNWCLFLGAFSYQIEFQSTKQHANCDSSSRLHRLKSLTN